MSNLVSVEAPLSELAPRAASAPADARPAPAPFSGHAIDVGGNRPFLVDDHSVWYVDRGDVDLFSVRLAAGVPAGPRSHLLRVGAGGILLGLGPDRGRGFVAVGTNGTRLVRAPRAALRELIEAPSSAERGRALLEGWITVVGEALVEGLPPKRGIELESGHELAIKEAVVARPRERVAWVQQVAGRSRLLGRAELPIEEGAVVAVSRDTWLEVQPGRVSASSLEDLAFDQALWAGLEHFTQLARRYTEVVADEQERAHADRAVALSAASEANIERACSRLAATLDPERGSPRDEDPSGAPAPTDHGEHPLLACCRRVGDAMGVPIKAPPGSDSLAKARDPLALIVRASRVRARKVALQGDWWRRDFGPLVAFTVAGERPVALLRSNRAYVLHEAGAAGELAAAASPGAAGTPVDAVAAATLGPFAYSFYRPFPDTALGMRSLLRFGARGSFRDLAVVVMLGLVATVMGMFPAYATGLLFNSVIPGAHRSQLWQMTSLLVVCALASTGFSLARSFALQRIQQRATTTVQAAVWDRLMRLPLPFFRPYTAGELASRAMSIDAIQQVLSGSTIGAILNGIFSLGNLAMMFYYSSAMSWRALILIGVAVVVTTVGGIVQLRPQRAMIRLSGKTSGLVLQLLSSISKLRVAGAEARAFAQWVNRFARQRRLQIKIRRNGNWLSAFSAAFPLLAYAFIYWAALPAPGQAGGVLLTGDFLAFGAAFSACLSAVLGTCMTVVGALNTISMYEQAKPIMEALPEVHVGRSDPGTLSGDIEIQHAVFRYHADGPPVLRDLSLHIEPGEFVAFVGPSGSGKSTIMKLLLGFEKLESGSIYYDGQEIGGLDIEEVRHQMGVVLQNGRLIAGDIFTNIVAAGNATLDEAWEAAAMAGIADDIKAMPMRMHTVISEGAGTLSGGQRQRLMIARAIVNRPRMLLFDEATSALDNRTQAIVSNSLERLRATRIVVAHRLSTIANADRICVIERGRIVQCGRYAELMKEKGLFADLARRQTT